MTYFISGHRDITPEEFEKFYVPAIVDVIDTCNNNYDDPYTIDDCPIVHYVGGFETDRDRDSAMTNASSEDIAFIRSKSKWDSGTAENILRRHTMKYLNPSFYGQQ